MPWGLVWNCRFRLHTNLTPVFLTDSPENDTIGDNILQKERKYVRTFKIREHKAQKGKK